MTDENRLAQVVNHWLPRIEAAGIPTATAQVIIRNAGEWPNWCRSWCAAGERQLALAEEAEASGWHLTAGESYARAALCFHFAQFMFFDDLEQKQAATVAKLAAFARAAPLLDPPVETLGFEVPGGRLKAHLRLPASDPAPLVILLPGSDSTKEEFPSVEHHFLRRGLATLSLDGPGQGEGRSLGPLRGDIGPQLAAVAEAIRKQSGIAAKRLGLVGMAFGGHLALRAAAAVPGLGGVVSMNGFHSLEAMWDAFPPVYRANLLFALGVTVETEARKQAQDFTLEGAAPPDCPALVLHGGRDRIFPVEEARRSTDFAQGECVILPEGNHVCNNLPWRYRPLMADWLAGKLSA